MNFGVLLCLCLFCLFFLPADIGFVLAFLYALCLSFACRFIQKERVLFFFSFCGFAAALFLPDFFCFYPVFFCVLFSKRQYTLSGIGGIFFLGMAARFLHADTAQAFAPPAALPLLVLSGILVSFCLSLHTVQYEALKDRFLHTQDDSRETNLLLAEKNQSLMEKQNYEIYAATLAERNRIAREIHDNVGHLLSRSILLLGAAKTINKDPSLNQALDSLELSLNSAMDSIRKSVHDLHDESVSLDEAVKSLIKGFTFCPVSYRYDCTGEVPREVKYSFISITKEALSNTMRHSDATHVSVLIREHPALYQLCIEDNGSAKSAETCKSRFPDREVHHADRGDSPGSAASDRRGSGIGILNMEERIHALHGNIQIQTAQGFKIFITVPKETTL